MTDRATVMCACRSQTAAMGNSRSVLIDPVQATQQEGGVGLGSDLVEGLP